jgi:hypothetical protein
MILPDLKDWRSWTAIIAAIGTVTGLLVTLAPRAEAFFYVSSQYFRDSLTPLLVLSYENKIEIIEDKQATIQMRIDNARARLRLSPEDAVARDALTAARQDYDFAEVQKADAQCALRQAQGLGCGRIP